MSRWGSLQIQFLKLSRSRRLFEPTSAPCWYGLPQRGYGNFSWGCSWRIGGWGHHYCRYMAKIFLKLITQFYFVWFQIVAHFQVMKSTLFLLTFLLLMTTKAMEDHEHSLYLPLKLSTGRKWHLTNLVFSLNFIWHHLLDNFEPIRKSSLKMKCKKFSINLLVFYH